MSIQSLEVEVDTVAYPTKNSFRLNFKHGEAIEFYADSRQEYETWMSVLEKLLRERPDAPQWLGEDTDEPVSASPPPLPNRACTATEPEWMSATGGEEEEAQLSRHTDPLNDFKVVSVKRTTKTNEMLANEKQRVTRKEMMMLPPVFEPITEGVAESALDEEIERMMAAASESNARSVSVFGRKSRAAY